MPESVPTAELLRALGRLVRGLSALFWGLPMALVVCVQTAKADWFRSFGVLPPLLVTAILCYGVHLLGNFQQQERVWRNALERAQILSIVNLALSPFLFWYSKIPSQPLFTWMVSGMAFFGILFLLALNPVLWRLAAMLPDETLRQETKLFTRLNRYLLLACLVLLVTVVSVASANSMMIEQIPDYLVGLLPSGYRHPSLVFLVDKGGVLLLVLLLVLLPIAMTMALIWKIKEVIFASVFGNEHP